MDSQENLPGIADDVQADKDILSRILEAIFWAADAPLSVKDICDHLGDAYHRDAVQSAISALQEEYQHRGFQLVVRGGRWHFQTAADLQHHVRAEQDQLRKLSRAATETLAIIAYHEPVSRAEIEAIRGVQVSKGTLDVLMEAGWVTPAGRRDIPGKPIIYATTPDFLSHFGLSSRRDLPGIDDLRAAGLLDPVDMEMADMLKKMEGSGDGDGEDDGDEG